MFDKLLKQKNNKATNFFKSVLWQSLKAPRKSRNPVANYLRSSNKGRPLRALTSKVPKSLYS